MPPLPAALARTIEQIAHDRMRGAAALARQAAQAIVEAGPELARMSPEEHRSVLEAIARRLVRAQPAMAPLVNLADALLRSSGDPAGRAQAFLAQLENAHLRVVEHAAALLPDGAAVLTHSCSQAVLEAMLAAHAAGKRLRVVCTESRPQQEGLVLARRLGEAGIPVTVIVDAAVGWKLPSVTLAVTGADSVSPSGVVNKMGTRLLALAAAAAGVPLYIFCSSEKFLPAGYSPPPEPAKPAEEILRETLPNVGAENFYFETTPLDSITGIISEEGLLTPADLDRRLRLRTAHPALAASTRSGA